MNRRDFAALPLLALLALPLQAAEMGCLTPEALAKGVQVVVPKGPPMRLRADRSGVRVDFLLGDFATRTTLARDGLVWVDELSQFVGQVPEGVVGGPAGQVTQDRFKLRGRGPEALPGRVWVGDMRILHDFDSASTGPQPTLDFKLQAHYEFSPEKTVRISGCDYRVLPVEVTLDAISPEDGSMETALRRRLIHFPDYGFSVPTRFGPDAGLAAQVTLGIVGFRPGG